MLQVWSITRFLLYFCNRLFLDSKKSKRCLNKRKRSKCMFSPAAHAVYSEMRLSCVSSKSKATFVLFQCLDVWCHQVVRLLITKLSKRFNWKRGLIFEETQVEKEIISHWDESMFYCHENQTDNDFVSKPATPPDTEYYNCANSLEKYVNTKLRDHGLITQT